MWCVMCVGGITDLSLSRGGNLLSGALAGTEPSSPRFLLSPVSQSSIKIHHSSFKTHDNNNIETTFTDKCSVYIWMIKYLFSQRHRHGFSEFVETAIDAVSSSFLDDFVRDWSSLWKQKQQQNHFIASLLQTTRIIKEKIRDIKR